MGQTPSAPSLADAVVGEHYHLRVPSRPDWIEPTVDYLTSRAVQSGAVGEGRAGRLMLALHEALTNSVVHGNLEVSSELRESGDLAYGAALVARAADPRYATRTVDVRASYDGVRASWAFTDEGPGFDVGAVLRRLDEHDPGEERAGGRGHRGVESRTSRQLGQEEKARRADLVVRNDGTREELEQELSRALATIGP
jgi:anti-sigma regulatory factor (Ser/Thr protein kinase)